MTRIQFHHLRDRLEQAIINKAFACEHYDKVMREFNDAVLQHCTLEPEERPDDEQDESTTLPMV